MWQKMESFVKTPLTSVNTMFEIDLVNIIPHYVTFSDDGRKPLFSVILWLLEGQNLANLPQSESILNTHSISVHNKCELDCVNTFSDNGQKPPSSFILWSLEGQMSDNGRKPPYSVILWPLEGQNLANLAQKRISSENSPNKCTQQVWIGLCEYFFR